MKQGKKLIIVLSIIVLCSLLVSIGIMTFNKLKTPPKSVIRMAITATTTMGSKYADRLLDEYVYYFDLNSNGLLTVKIGTVYDTDISKDSFLGKVYKEEVVKLSKSDVDYLLELADSIPDEEFYVEDTSFLLDSMDTVVYYKGKTAIRCLIFCDAMSELIDQLRELSPIDIVFYGY